MPTGFFSTIWPAVILWAVVAIIAIIIEANTAQLVSVWYATAAIISCILAAFKVEFWIQGVTFAVVSLVLLLISRPYAKKINAQHVAIEGTAEGLVGEVVIVTKEFDHDTIGEVKARYDRYSAMTEESEPFSLGEKAIVATILGNKVLIKKIHEQKER